MSGSIYFKEFREAKERMAGEYTPDRNNPTELDEPLLPFKGEAKQYNFQAEPAIYTERSTNFGAGVGRPQQFQIPSRGRESIRSENDPKDIDNPYRLGRAYKQVRSDTYEGW